MVAGVTINSVANEQQQHKLVKVELRGSDFRELKTVSADLIRRLLKIDGVRDIESYLSEGDP